ncbi:MAG: chromate transporter [Clostridia bacterium]|nr:chromate transporter [Clostridia bacterium]
MEHDREFISYRQKLKDLFLISLKLGAFTFGGGYAMFPLLVREYAQNKKYFSDEEMLDILAVAQSLPGMIAINACILIGYRLCSLPGALVAVLGMALPSLIVMSVISFFYVRFSTNEYVISALKGIRVAVIALLIQAVIKLGKQGVKGAFGWIVAVSAFLFSVFSGVHLIFIIIAGGLAGILYSYLINKENTAPDNSGETK